MQQHLVKECFSDAHCQRPQSSRHAPQGIRGQTLAVTGDTTEIKLSCYLGKLPVMGELHMSVLYNGVSFDCPLIIIDCAGPSLCGSDLVAQLSKSGLPVFSLTAQPDALSGMTWSAVEDILADF